MTQNGLKHILNRSLKIMEFDIADPPTNYGIFHNFFFLNEGFLYQELTLQCLFIVYFEQKK